MLRRLASWYLRRAERGAKPEPWSEAQPLPRVRVRLGSGRSCEVRQEFAISGLGKVWLCTGIGVVE